MSQKSRPKLDEYLDSVQYDIIQYDKLYLHVFKSWRKPTQSTTWDQNLKKKQKYKEETLKNKNRYAQRKRSVKSSWVGAEEWKRVYGRKDLCIPVQSTIFSAKATIRFLTQLYKHWNFRHRGFPTATHTHNAHNFIVIPKACPTQKLLDSYPVLVSTCKFIHNFFSNPVNRQVSKKPIFVIKICYCNFILVRYPCFHISFLPVFLFYYYLTSCGTERSTM